MAGKVYSFSKCLWSACCVLVLFFIMNNMCVCVFVCVCVCVSVAQLYPTCDPMDFSPPGSSVQGILQARVLERVAISFYHGTKSLLSLNFHAGEILIQDR